MFSRQDDSQLMQAQPPPRIFDVVDDRYAANEPEKVAPAKPQEADWSGVEQLSVEQPEAVFSEGISLKGRLSFTRYIRIDGHFEGEIDSEGKIVVGPNGVVKSNIVLREAIIEGCVEGNIVVKERLELRGEAKVIGDIQARLLSIDEGVTIVGQVSVKPYDNA